MRSSIPNYPLVPLGLLTICVDGYAGPLAFALAPSRKSSPSRDHRNSRLLVLLLPVFRWPASLPALLDSSPTWQRHHLRHRLVGKDVLVIPSLLARVLTCYLPPVLKLFAG